MPSFVSSQMSIKLNVCEDTNTGENEEPQSPGTFRTVLLCQGTTSQPVVGELAQHPLAGSSRLLGVP